MAFLLQRIAIVSVLCVSPAEGQTSDAQLCEASEAPPESPTDDDGWPDPSGFLDEKFGFLPLALAVTDPAMGYGGGAVWNDFERFDDTQSVVTGGGGFRYELARKYGIHIGLDVAFDPDNTAVYLQIGSAWARP